MLQLVLHFAVMVLLLVLHFVGQSNDALDRERLRVKLDATQAELTEQKTANAEMEQKLRDWWAIDTRNLRKAVEEDVETMLEKGRQAAPEGE